MTLDPRRKLGRNRLFAAARLPTRFQRRYGCRRRSASSQMERLARIALVKRRQLAQMQRRRLLVRIQRPVLEHVEQFSIFLPEQAQYLDEAEACIGQQASQRAGRGDAERCEIVACFDQLVERLAQVVGCGGGAGSGGYPLGQLRR